MKIHSDVPTEDVQIQIIPLIDVIFCILTFFILAALQLTRQQAIGVDLPKASTGAAQMREMLTVTLNSSGQSFVNQQPVDRSQLYSLLRDYHQKNPKGLLVLDADKQLPYNEVVQVLDTMRAVGGDRAALAVYPTDPSQPSGSNAPNPTTPNSIGRPTPPTANPTLTPFPLYSIPSPYPTNPGQSAPPGNSSNLNPPSSGLPNSSPVGPDSGTQRR